MAKNKKSFILYCDYIHTFNQLPDDVAGKLIKHLFEYVNDENPETDELIIKAVFEPIKQQLKRDLKKYEGIQDRNRANGSKGGRPKKPKENPKNPVGLSGNPKNPKKPDTVTVTDTVTVNDNEVDIYLLEEKVSKVIDRFKETNYEAKERSFKTDKDNLVIRLEEFLEENKLNNEFKNKQYGHVITWFWRWLNYNKPKEVVKKSAAPWLGRN